MVSGQSSPLPHITPGGRRRASRATSPNGRKQSLHASEIFMGTDGDLHDPGYHNSLKTLRAQIEASSSLHSASSSSSLQRRATINSGNSRSGSFASSHIPPFLAESRRSYAGQVDGTTYQETSSSEDEPDEDDNSILNERKRSNSSSSYASPFSATTLFTSSSTSPLVAPTGTPRRRTLTISSAGSSVQRDRRFSSAASRRGSVEDTEELVYEAPPLLSSNSRRQGSSLRSSFSLASPSHFHSTARERSTSTQPTVASNAVDNWQGGFASLVDAQRERRLWMEQDPTARPSTSCGVFARGPMQQTCSRNSAESTTSMRSPSYSELTGHKENSASFDGTAGYFVKRSSASKSDGKPMNSSNGSTRGHDLRGVTDDESPSGIRQRRSESDPMCYHSGSHSGEKGGTSSLFAAGYRPLLEANHFDTTSLTTQVQSSAFGHHLSPIESRINEMGSSIPTITAARSSFSVRPANRSRAGSSAGESLAPVEEYGGYGHLVSPGGKGGKEAARQQKRIGREKSSRSSRLPFLGRRSSPVATLVQSSSPPPDISASEEVLQDMDSTIGRRSGSDRFFSTASHRSLYGRSSGFGASGRSGILDTASSSSSEDVSHLTRSFSFPSPLSLPRINTSSGAAASATTTVGRSAVGVDTLNDSMRRKMQKLGLGMRFKALQAEKKWKKAFAHGGEDEREIGRTE